MERVDMEICTHRSTAGRTRPKAPSPSTMRCPLELRQNSTSRGSISPATKGAGAAPAVPQGCRAAAGLPAPPSAPLLP